jgi:antitoxin Phd
MKIKTEEIVTMTEANQNFSKVARKVKKQGRAIIFKHNSPKY